MMHQKCLLDLKVCKWILKWSVTIKLTCLIVMYVCITAILNKNLHNCK